MRPSFFVPCPRAKLAGFLLRTLPLLIAPLVAQAQTASPSPISSLISPLSGQRPVTSVYNIELASQRDISTYLSPLFYTGWDLGVSGSWSKAFNHRPERWLMRFEAGLDLSNMHNPVKTALMFGLTAQFRWGMLARWRPAPRWQVAVGPMLDIFGGALYISRNGNNPVTAMFQAGVAAAAMGSYRFHIGRLPMLLTDEVMLPTLSGFFSPEYGEPYYEIYLGNHSGLAHLGWWGNAFGINNLLSVKLDFGRTAMQVGYRLDYRSYYADHLTTRTLRHALVIGIIPQGLGLKHPTPHTLRYDY